MRGLLVVGVLLSASPAWADPPPDPAARALVVLLEDGREQAALARLARARAGRRAVRSFAARVERDVRQVERAVARLGHLPTAGPGSPASSAWALRAVPRTSFDAAFLIAMRTHHDRAVAVATSGLTSARPSPARELLARLLPVLRQDARLVRLVEEGA
jgi:predicted outer membrane protein